MQQDIDTLTAARNAAFSAWQACPEKGKAAKAAKARLEAELAAASRALTAAKRAAAEAAAPAPAVSATEALRAIADAGGKAVSPAAAREKARAQAMRVIRSAWAWPRCGEGFPAISAEVAAEAWAIDAYGSVDGAMEAGGVFS